MIDRDFERALSYLTVNAQKNAVGGLYIGAAYAAQADPDAAQSFARIAEKHGLVRNDASIPDSDWPRAFADIARWIEKNLADTAGGGMLDKMVDQVRDSRFADFETDGDTAKATMTTGERTKRVRFKRVDDRWLMDG